MRFSTRTTYGIRAMARLAQNEGGKPLSLPAIAREERLPLGYLERLFCILKKAGFVDSRKGKGGGYYLKDKPEKIRVLDIIRPLEGDINLLRCVGDDGRIQCGRKYGCSATKALMIARTAINDSLKKIKLSDLI